MEKALGKGFSRFLVIALAAVVIIFAILWQYPQGHSLRLALNGSQTVSSGSTGFGVAPSMPAYDMSYEKGSDIGIGGIMPPIPGPTVPPSTKTIPKDKKVIRNGSLNLIVEKAEDAQARIQSIALKYDGFIESANIYEVSEGVKSGTLTVRVVNTDFDRAMADIKAVALKVQNESVTSEDVTAQYIDLEAQLKNLKVEEEQYQAILKKAQKIEEILQVSQYLSSVRSRIEQTQGQLNYLSRQVGMSTITIQLTAQSEVEVFGIVWKPLIVLKQAARALVNDLVNFVNEIIFFVFKLPVLILRIGLIVLVLWVVWRIVMSTVKRFKK